MSKKKIWAVNEDGDRTEVIKVMPVKVFDHVRDYLHIVAEEFRMQGRDPDLYLIGEYLEDACILMTAGGYCCGSLESAICSAYEYMEQCDRAGIAVNLQWIYIRVLDYIDAPVRFKYYSCN